MKRVAIIILILFLIVGGVGVWYWQSNTYSKEVLKVEMVAPDKVDAGEKMEYLLTLKNNGDVRMEDPQIVFEFPKQSISEDYSKKRINKEIDVIYPGEERTYSFSARLFAAEGSTLRARASINFRPANLTSRYELDTSKLIEIERVPITFEFDLPSKVGKGEKIDFSLNYFSNMNYALEDLRVKARYPKAFDFQRATPKAMDNSEWSLSALVKGSGGRVDIQGKISGEEGKRKIFNAELGIIKDGSFWLLKEISQDIKIIKPSFNISYLINNSQDLVANAGDLLHYEVYFNNIGDRSIHKKVAMVKLNGELYDLSSLRSPKGEFGQGDNAILWDWKDVSSLRFLEPGEEGKIEFWVELKEDIKRKSEDLELKTKASIGGVEKTFHTKVNSSPSFTQKAYYKQEVFESEGPLPPVVGEKTKYVVFWEVKNTWNKLKDVKVKSELGKNVKPTGETFPEDASFTYDSDSKSVMWKVGKLSPWEGTTQESSSTLAFQVELTPDAPQKERPATLVKEASLTGTDTWTQEILRAKDGLVNTMLSEDETTTSSEGIVE